VTTSATSSPSSTPASTTNQANPFFKSSILQPQVQQAQQPRLQVPNQPQQPQTPQIQNSYRAFLFNPAANQNVQQQQQPQPAHQQPTMYGAIATNPQTRMMFAVQQQPNQQQQQSVIHANPQTIQQQPQQPQQPQFGVPIQRVQVPQTATPQPRVQGFGMYSQTPAQPVQQQQPQVAAQPQTRVIIGRDVQQQASNIFSSSNCLTRPEKALIPGFLAGTQPNPAPHMGPISMIKYLEKLEEHRTTSGTVVNVLVEEHFQMNFSNGEWKLVRSIRQADMNQRIGGNDQGNQTRIVVLDPQQDHHFITINQGRAAVVQTQTIPQQVAGQVIPGAPMGLVPGQPIRPGAAPGSQYMRA